MIVIMIASQHLHASLKLIVSPICEGSTTVHAVFRACTPSCFPRHPREADHTQAMHQA